jgi:hypothetical protein
MLVVGMPRATSADEAFKTAEAAADALFSAVKADDANAILRILGRGGAQIASSGDAVADAEMRSRFVSAYTAKHQVTMEGDNRAILVIGSEDFPFPIPLVRKGDNWRFDTVAGRTEILKRRIGRNELNTIQAALAYVDAQNEYADKDHGDAGTGIYAQRIVSQPGKKDGLYWPTSQGDDPSPLGELAARATAEGYRIGGERAPFHGYYFKILTKQGPAAAGGAMDYVVNGKMIGGFALVAYPASYRNSGVMTFVVNHNGTIYQKDLGKHTARIAERMTTFNPDASWKKVDVAELSR